MTAASVITGVRRLLRDESAPNYRWTDAQLLRAVSDAERHMRHLRPDLFLGAGDTMSSTTELTALTDSLVLDEESRRPLEYSAASFALEMDAGDEANSRQAREYDALSRRYLGVG